jgi:opacity protein-like surface antigen
VTSIVGSAWDLLGGVQYQLTDRVRADFRYNRSLTLLIKIFTSTTKLYLRGLEFSVMYKIGQHLSKK